MSSLFGLIQGFLQTQEGDGFLLFWAKEILGALLILALFWAMSHLVIMVPLHGP